MNQASFKTGVFYMLLSAAGLAFIGFFGKLGLEEFSLTSLVFWRYLVSVAFCTLLLVFTGGIRDLRLEEIPLNFFRALCVLGAQYAFYYYIERGTLLNGVTLLNTGPLFIPIVEKITLKHKIGKSSWAGLIVSFAGILCILQPDAGLFSWLSLIGLSAGIFQACSQVLFSTRARQGRPECGVFFLMLSAAALSVIPYLIFPGPTLVGTGGFWTVCGLVFVLAAVSVLNQLPRAAAYSHGKPSRLAPFLYFSVLVAALLDWAFFDLVPNALTAFGAALVVLGGVLKIYLRHRILSKK